MAALDRLAWIDDELGRLASEDLLRVPRTRSGPMGPSIELDGQKLISFASNDYLSLAADARVLAAAVRAAAREGWGAGASPLVVGRGEAQAQLETRLAEFLGAEAALVFNSGFAANLGTLAALAGPGDAIFSDLLNHASLIDGCRLSRAEVHVYRHGDVGALEGLLRGAAGARRRLIVTDTLFSMEGDLAPLPQLADLAERTGALLVTDEAHATGVFGPGGRGVAEHFGPEVAARVDVHLGTLSKALGSAGGFVCGTRGLVDWLIQRARPYVFSTALPPAACAAAHAALRIVEAEPARRSELLERAQALRGRLSAAGWQVGSSAGPIVPLRVGEPAAAVAMSERLKDEGLFVPAIRPPSVPAGGSLLRVSLNWGHTPEMIDRLVEAVGAG